MALAFGVTALIAPVRIRPAVPALLAVPAASGALFAGLALDGRLGRVDGAVLVAVYLWRLGRKGVAIEAEGEAAEALGHPPSRALAIGWFAVSLGLLVTGSKLLVDRARDLIDAAG